MSRRIVLIKMDPTYLSIMAGSSATMEHACSRIQCYISKQLLRILEAPGMLHEKSIIYACAL